MKIKFNICSVLLFFIIHPFSNMDLQAQLKISVGGGIKVHMTEGKSINSFSGAFDKDKAQQIGQFFEDANIYAIGASYIFGLSDTSLKTVYIAGFEFSRGVSKNLKEQYMPFFGEYLTITSYSPYLGIGIRPKLKARNLMIFITAGISYKTYSGIYKNEIPWKKSKLEINSSFVNSIFPRFGLDIDYKPSRTLPLVISAELGLEVGSVERSNISISNYGKNLGEAYPTGQINIPDNSLIIKLSAAYLIDL